MTRTLTTLVTPLDLKRHALVNVDKRTGQILKEQYHISFGLM
jgi:hypothetical protein